MAQQAGSFCILAEPQKYKEQPCKRGLDNFDKDVPRQTSALLTTVERQVLYCCVGFKKTYFIMRFFLVSKPANLLQKRAAHSKTFDDTIRSAQLRFRRYRPSFRGKNGVYRRGYDRGVCSRCWNSNERIPVCSYGEQKTSLVVEIGRAIFFQPISAKFKKP